MDRTQIKKWLSEYLVDFSHEKNLASTTVRHKKLMLEPFHEFSLTSSKEFGASLCRDYFQYKFDKGCKADNSRLNVVKYMRAFVNFLYKRKYITESFAEELERPKIHRKILELVSEEQLEKIIIAGTELATNEGNRNKFIRNEMRDALFFLSLTGLRVNEMRRLTNKDLHLNDDPLYFSIQSKGGNIDMMEVPSNAYDVLKARENNIRTFKVTEEALNVALRRGCKKWEIKTKVTCHKLRHIFALTRLRRGEPLQKVSRLLRHRSVAVTDKYYSHYLLDDLSHTLNNTKILQSGLSIETIVDDLEKEIKKNLDPRLTLEVNRVRNELSVRIKW